MGALEQSIRGVELWPGETILDKVHAILYGLNNTRDLYLTSRRLVWVAHRIRLPFTAMLSERQVVLRFEEIERCYARAFSLSVEAGGNRFRFSLYRWVTPLLWWRLTRRWVSAINAAVDHVRRSAI